MAAFCVFHDSWIYTNPGHLALKGFFYTKGHFLMLVGGWHGRVLLTGSEGDPRISQRCGKEMQTQAAVSASWNFKQTRSWRKSRIQLDLAFTSLCLKLNWSLRSKAKLLFKVTVKHDSCLFKRISTQMKLTLIYVGRSCGWNFIATSDSLVI